LPAAEVVAPKGTVAVGLLASALRWDDLEPSDTDADDFASVRRRRAEDPAPSERLDEWVSELKAARFEARSRARLSTGDRLPSPLAMHERSPPAVSSTAPAARTAVGNEVGPERIPQTRCRGSKAYGRSRSPNSSPCRVFPPPHLAFAPRGDEVVPESGEKRRSGGYCAGQDEQPRSLSPCPVPRSLSPESQLADAGEALASKAAIAATRIPRLGGGVGPPISASLTTPQRSRHHDRVRSKGRSSTPQRPPRLASPSKPLPFCSAPSAVALQPPADTEDLRKRCAAQRELLENQAAALAHEEQRRSAAEKNFCGLSEEVEFTRLAAAAHERADLQSEVETLREEYQAVELQSEALCHLHAIPATPLPPWPHLLRSEEPQSQVDLLRAVASGTSRQGAREEALAVALAAAESREALQIAAAARGEAERANLRSELQAEASAMRRAGHHAEEQQWRLQALLEHTQQQASCCESQVQELRATLRARDDSFEERLAEARRAAADREAAELARAEASLRAEFGAEREALYARVREQLVELTSCRSSPGRGPWNMANQQVV